MVMDIMISMDIMDIMDMMVEAAAIIWDEEYWHRLKSEKMMIMS